MSIDVDSNYICECNKLNPHLYKY